MLVDTGFTYDDLLLVPKKRLKSRNEVDLSVRLHDNLILDSPIISANMDTVTNWKVAAEMYKAGGLGILHRNMASDDVLDQIYKARAAGCKKIGASVGVQPGNMQRVIHLVAAKVDVIAVDVAYAFSDDVGDFIREVKGRTGNIPIMAGNVATADGVAFLAEAGADIVKIGVGPGSVCTTRMITGNGYPQLTAIHECAVSECRHWQGNTLSGPTIIADGGIKRSGDIVKALAMGADAVMIGGLLAGCEEAPGEVHGSGRSKLYRGMASKDMNFGGAPEGVQTFIPLNGTVSSVMNKLKDGIKAGASIQGCKKVNTLRGAATWIRVTPAGREEGDTKY